MKPIVIIQKKIFKSKTKFKTSEGKNSTIPILPIWKAIKQKAPINLIDKSNLFSKNSYAVEIFNFLYVGKKKKTIIGVIIKIEILNIK